MTTPPHIAIVRAHFVSEWKIRVKITTFGLNVDSYARVANQWLEP